jgi:[glutamine synthetase] adenylyltransferase / [glutamine synthetase]-adenylyl-L-tyrosine phosphorylase
MPNTIQMREPLLSLVENIHKLPNSAPEAALRASWEHFEDVYRINNSETLSIIKATPLLSQLLNGIFSYSPYLTRCLLQQPAFFSNLCQQGIDITAEQWENSLPCHHELQSRETLMKAIRQHKVQGALLASIADICGYWDDHAVCELLSGLAARTLSLVVDYLLLEAQQKGDVNNLNPQAPSQGSGYVLLGMGKLGGRELNYSSDIDLVVLFDPDKIQYQGRHSAQHFFNKITQDMVTCMQERTEDGYVFRTDLRLRPDPGSTPPAVNLKAAMNYYESVGQNWERAAFIKARPVAGDLEAGNAFLKSLTPFLWRRSLDFAAINDIQSIKRQMDASMPRRISLLGHNIKTGLGGIREIEFFAQINQLIWGGRHPELRIRPTVETLHQLADLDLIPHHQAEVLSQHYWTLRHIEHRLQMQEDQQTHSLPASEEKLATLALFCGYPSLEEFSFSLERILMEVHREFSQLYEDSPSLAGEAGSLVFTGVEPDPQTVETLRQMGFADPVSAVTQIQNWHRGTFRACRSARARELLTELTPPLLRALAASADPDQAFANFARFLERLPSGVQIFSFLISNPPLLSLLGTIMGSAPWLGEQISRNPDRLDIILTAGYGDFGKAPDPAPMLRLAQHEDDRIRWLCKFRNEQEFLVGTELLRGNLTTHQANTRLSQLADAALKSLLEMTTDTFRQSYGDMPTGSLCVISLGRLGAQESTFGSDLDLIYLYHVEDENTVSTGDPPRSASVYYNRLFQRYSNNIQLQTPEGRLYEVDTRLRPGGNDGPLAVSFDAFQRYYDHDAWLFESMALVRSRAVAGDSVLQKNLDHYIRSHLLKTRQPATVFAHMREMRERIRSEFPDDNPFRPKHARGGVLELTLLAHALVLTYGATHPSLLARENAVIFAEAKMHGILSQEQAASLIAAEKFQQQLLTLIRLTQGDMNSEDIPQGLQKLLCQQLEAETFEKVREKLLYHQEIAHRIFTYFSGLTEASQKGE